MLGKSSFGHTQRHAILRATGAGQTGLDRAHVQFEDVGVVRSSLTVDTPQALGLGIGFDQRDLLGGAARQFEVADGLFVDREDGAGAAELGRHVADGGAVGQRQMRQTIAEELDKLIDHAFLAQHLGDGQHQIGGGGASRQLAVELEADDLRDEHGDRLAQHGGLGLDTTHAPAQHAQTIDHGGMRVGADDGVRVSLQALAFFGEDDAGQVLHVDLVHDAGVGRHHAEIAKGTLAPAQERIALTVALELHTSVVSQRMRAAVFVDLYRMVDDHLGRGQRVDLLGIAAQTGDGFAHGGQINHAGHAGEVLHDHARWRERDFVTGGSLGIPVEQGFNVCPCDVDAVFKTQLVFQQDLQRERQPGQLCSRQCAQIPEVVVVGACAQRLAGLEAIGHGASLIQPPIIALSAQ